MKRLLYINNYNCSSEHKEGYPDNHLWGADYLTGKFEVVCAKVPGDIVSNRIPYGHVLNSLYRQMALFVRHPFIGYVYSACGDLTDMFALANVLHIGHRKLYKITHHGNGAIRYPNGYDRIMFISQVVRDRYSYLGNTRYIEWGGDSAFAKRFLNVEHPMEFDFISAGKTGRDYKCMITAAGRVEAKTLIVSDINNVDYPKDKITVLCGNREACNSLDYDAVFSCYAKSRFIVIPCSQKDERNVYTINGLTSFVDAVVMHKPVLVSSSSNMGIDFEKLGIGLVYEAGNSDDMQRKMESLLNLGQEEYERMCHNMAVYSETHNYVEFCKQLVNVID